MCSFQATKTEVARDLKVRKHDSQIEQLAVRQKRYALVIGVDRYDDAQITPLVGASNDARALRDVLIKRAEFPSDQIILQLPISPASVARHGATHCGVSQT